MDDIKDRLLWRADNAGDGFHSDMIYRDALRCIEALDKRIEALEAALRELDSMVSALDAGELELYQVGDFIDAMLAGEKK